MSAGSLIGAALGGLAVGFAPVDFVKVVLGVVLIAAAVKVAGRREAVIPLYDDLREVLARIPKRSTTVRCRAKHKILHPDYQAARKCDSGCTRYHGGQRNRGHGEDIYETPAVFLPNSTRSNNTFEWQIIEQGWHRNTEPKGILARARSEGKRLGRPPIAPELKKAIREALNKPGRTEGVRKIVERFGVNPGTVQRISRPFADASGAAA